MHSPLPYRRDIDGLRAIAVLSVVIFHAFPSVLHGGFVGVDIFFVISGFLITGTLIDDLAKGEFDLLSFYARRVRRLFPALVTVMTATLLIGALLLYDDEFARLGRHLRGAALFVLNFVLFDETGYFDVAARMKPLLHLWSLSIEEQFYLIWPLLLWLFRRPPRFLPVMAAVAGGTFLVSLGLLAWSREAAYYFPFSRFWELALGGVAAVAVRRPGRLGLDRFRPELAAAAGLGLIALSFRLITERSAFPGGWALLPTVGAALLLVFADRAPICGRLLSLRPMTWFGAISYPLYLWHWPLLSFLWIRSGDLPGRGERLAAVLLAVLLAWLTWRLIERPIRFGRWRGRRRVPLALCGAMALMLAFGWSLDLGGGRGPRPDLAAIDLSWPANVVPGYRDDPFAQAVFGNDFNPEIDFFRVRPGRGDAVAFIGDSHANRLYEGVAALGPAAGLGPLYNVGRGTCLPALDFAVRPNCQPVMGAAVRAAAARPEIRTVVITAFYRQYQADTAEVSPTIAPDHRADPERLAAEIAAIVAAIPRDKAVVLALDVPTLPERDPCHRRPVPVWAGGGIPRCTVSRAEWKEKNRPLVAALRRLTAADPRLALFDPATLLCDDRRCGEIDPDHQLYALDGNHLSLAGAVRVAAGLTETLRRLERGLRAPEAAEAAIFDPSIQNDR